MDRRRFSDPRAAAEAAFKAATTKAAPAGTGPETAPRAAARAAPPVAPPGVRETVSLRLDSAVLAHFQEDGPGWQDRINEVLKAHVARARG